MKLCKLENPEKVLQEELPVGEKVYKYTRCYHFHSSLNYLPYLKHRNTNKYMSLQMKFTVYCLKKD